MKKPIHWKDSMSVDVVSLDDEHKALIELLNRFTALAEGDGDLAEARALFAEIVQHTRDHFVHEERVMHNIGYGNFNEHRRQHQALLDNAAEVGRQLEQATTVAELQPIVAFLTHMVVRHMSETDHGIGLYIERDDRFPGD